MGNIIFFFGIILLQTLGVPTNSDSNGFGPISLKRTAPIIEKEQDSQETLESYPPFIHFRFGMDKQTVQEILSQHCKDPVMYYKTNFMQDRELHCSSFPFMTQILTPPKINVLTRFEFNNDKLIGVRIYFIENKSLTLKQLQHTITTQVRFMKNWMSPRLIFHQEPNHDVTIDNLMKRLNKNVAQTQKFTPYFEEENHTHSSIHGQVSKKLTSDRKFLYTVEIDIRER